MRHLARDSGAVQASHLVGAHAPLFELARGRGMANLASTLYATADWNLVLVAIHESGHALAASALGCDARIEIERTPAGFAGLCHFWGHSRPGAERQVALAGRVAEALAEYGFYTDSRDVRAFTSPRCLSDADRVLAGNFTESDVDACSALVRKHWAGVISIADRVLAQEVARWRP